MKYLVHRVTINSMKAFKLTFIALFALGVCFEKRWSGGKILPWNSDHAFKKLFNCLLNILNLKYILYLYFCACRYNIPSAVPWKSWRKLPLMPMFSYMMFRYSCIGDFTPCRNYEISTQLVITTWKVGISKVVNSSE